MTSLHKKLKFLKLDGVYNFELGKFMFQLSKENVPKIFYASFTTINQIHHYKTRNNEKAVYSRPRMNQSFSQKTLSFRATKIWKEIDNDMKRLHWVPSKRLTNGFYCNRTDAYCTLRLLYRIIFIEYMFLSI